MFNTKRGLFKYILLSILTLGVYSLVVLSHIGEEINIIAAKDGKHTMHYLFVALLLGPLTLGVAYLVWFHRISNRIGMEAINRGILTDFNASSFWIWSVLGTLFVVGPFVYMYKLLHIMNKMNHSFCVNKQ